MRAGDDFAGVEGGGAWRYAVGCERFVRGVRDCFWREGMRQRFEGGVVVEREVNAFVGVDEDDDTRSVGWLRVMREGDTGRLRVARACIRVDVRNSACRVRQFPAGRHGLAIRLCGHGPAHRCGIFDMPCPYCRSIGIVSAAIGVVAMRRCERELVRIGEAVRVAVPVGERCDVVAASGHGCG